jgi:hypothetical protein
MIKQFTWVGSSFVYVFIFTIVLLVNNADSACFTIVLLVNNADSACFTIILLVNNADSASNSSLELEVRLYTFLFYSVT